MTRHKVKYRSGPALPVMLACAILWQSCSGLDCLPEQCMPGGNVLVKVTVSGAESRAMDPDEARISDINILVFNEYGVLEDHAYMTFGQSAGEGGISWNADLVRNATYSIYACANFGYAFSAADTEELESMKYYMAYPDDYSAGLPMSGQSGKITVTGDEVTIPLQRLMAKISISIDRSMLDDDVEFNVRSIQVEGCPRSVTPFSRNHIRDPFDFFPSGFLRKDYETDMLNTVYPDGRSGETCLYTLENMQGDLLPGNADETLKVLDEDSPARELCTYIEIKAEYMSSSGYSLPGKYLVYRFYPGENPGNFDVCRNSEYRIVITPSGSGLDGTSWRIDKSGIGYYTRAIELSYTDIRLSYIGEIMEICPYLTPEGMGEEWLEWYSDDESVATVSDEGIVRATGEGECTVTCHVNDGSGCKAECLVTVDFAPYYMKVFPGNFIRCRKGDILNLKCDYFPTDAPFDIGIEELEYDKGRGIYDYVIGEDGKSVTLVTKSRGSGLLYMEAGYPVNQAEMIVVVVD